ncbi:MAG: GNAT family N-acetyltransferase, partial [Clostridiales bacterium]|nr:GNAT family N-acetyltransferase [Clostridiales bacterium]
MYIRKGDISDLKDVAKIAEAAWESIYEGYRAQLGDEIFNVFYSNWREDKPSSVCKAIESGEWNLFVTEKAGYILGFITIQMDKSKKVGVIGNNAVDINWQGHGIGSAQYRYVLNFMRDEGIEYIKVTTGLDDAHAPARRAYENVGFSRSLSSVTYYMELKDK